VWLSFADEPTVTVCQGNVDKVGYSLGEEGFVLYAEIHSDQRIVKWFATETADNTHGGRDREDD
jgi:hypothetical protein